MFIPFESEIQNTDLPNRFTFPFYYDVHPLAKHAVDLLQQRLKTEVFGHDFGIGRQQRAEAITVPPSKVAASSISLARGAISEPANGATNQQLDIVITWDRPAMAKWYDVYFGEDNPPTTKVSDDQAARSYVPTMALDTTYYVRIDAANALGSTTGDVVSFSTWSADDILLDENNNPITDHNGEYIETA